MKRVLIIFVLMAQLVAQSAAPQFALAGGSFSESFQLSVTIPAIIGLNVPDPDAAVQATNTPLNWQDLVTSNTEVQTTEIAMVRNYQNIILRTLVVR